MNLDQLRAYKHQTLAIAKDYDVGNLCVFGSVGYGQVNQKSNVDFPVHIKYRTGWNYFGLYPILRDLLKCI